MRMTVTRFDYLRRAGAAWVRLEGDAPDSGLDMIPTLEMKIQFAVRATQSEAANATQIVIRHPAVAGLNVVAWFLGNDLVSAGSGQKPAWPAQAAYRYKAVQLLANLVACAELETFGSAIPTIIP